MSSSQAVRIAAAELFRELPDCELHYCYPTSGYAIKFGKACFFLESRPGIVIASGFDDAQTAEAYANNHGLTVKPHSFA